MYSSFFGRFFERLATADNVLTEGGGSGGLKTEARMPAEFKPITFRFVQENRCKSSPLFNNWGKNVRERFIRGKAIFIQGSATRYGCGGVVTGGCTRDLLNFMGVSHRVKCLFEHKLIFLDIVSNQGNRAGTLSYLKVSTQFSTQKELLYAGRLITCADDATNTQACV